jgi:CheY-like chemotaxis protein
LHKGETALNAKIILMADNLQEFLDERREFLEREGYTVITAYNPVDAETILERGAADLAILDIRMVDDDDQEDTSGLDLARKFGGNTPIIMLTGYPTWEKVKDALGKDFNGLSPAVDFIAKQEGPEVMVQAVKLTLENPTLKENVLQEFQVESSQALHETLQKKEPAETTDKFQKSLERTERDLLQHRKEITVSSERYQKIAIVMGLVGTGVIIAGAILVFLKVVTLGILSGVAGVVSDAICVFFINRAVQISKQVDKNYQELQEIYRASHLISICDTIETRSKREKTKILILEKLTGKWFHK